VKDITQGKASSGTLPARYDVIVVGAGFSGLYMLHRVRALGLSVKVLEAGDDIGGTWYWNRYPGARCDVESMQYSYSFSEALQQEWEWSERFATQPEILRYINHVADRFDLRRDVQLNTRVTSNVFNEAANQWEITAESGERFVATYCIMATGCLSAGRLPDIPGIDSFRGQIVQTSRWPKEGVELAGKRVGVIGTGSTGIQAIPMLAQQAGQLFVFQRSPNFTVPARNAPLSKEYVQSWKSDYQALRRTAREETRSGTIYDFPTQAAFEVDGDARQREFEARWRTGGANFMYAFNDLLFDQAANDEAAEFVRQRIRETVKDPEVAKALMPTDHPIGAKRICVDTDYYATYNRENVRLINLRESPIRQILPDGVQTEDAVYELDVLVFATGFDAITGALQSIDLQGVDGVRLKDKWVNGPRAYLGLVTQGFPNLFMVTGPGSPAVLSNMLVSIEQHVDWITDCLVYMKEQGLNRIDADGTAENAWAEHVNEVAHTTLYPQANSWYIGANIPGKPRVFMPYVGVDAYRRKCNEVAAAGYDGFVLEKVAQASAGAGGQTASVRAAAG